MFLEKFSFPDPKGWKISFDIRQDCTLWDGKLIFMNLSEILHTSNGIIRIEKTKPQMQKTLEVDL